MTLDVHIPKYIPTLETHITVHASLSTDADAKDEEVANVLLNSLRSGSVKKRAYQDIEELAQTVRGIRTIFQNISSSLSSFDDTKFKEKCGDRAQLRLEWGALKERFDVAIQASYETATSAVNVMKEIVAIIGIDPLITEASWEDLKAEADNVVKAINKKMRSGSKTRDNFRILANDIRQFSVRIKVVFQDDEDLKGELADAQILVKNLSETLEALDNDSFYLTISACAGTAIFVTAALAAIWTLSPALTGIMSASSSVAIDSLRELVEKNKQKNATREMKMRAEADVRTLLTRPDTYSKECMQVAKRIDTIMNIWETMRTDMLYIAENLRKQSNVSSLAEADRVFWTRMDLTRKTYELLTGCLEVYVEQSRSVYDATY